jgi:RES domain-containing protein
VEAYRHLVDDIEGMTAERVRRRLLIRAQVIAHDVIDLRSPAARIAVGLSDDELFSAVGDYDACRQIGHVAHQLGLHGILAPAATRLGETLALFVDLLSPAELPAQIGEPIVWNGLPADPRRLRLVIKQQPHAGS